MYCKEIDCTQLCKHWKGRRSYKLSHNKRILTTKGATHKWQIWKEILPITNESWLFRMKVLLKPKPSLSLSFSLSSNSEASSNINSTSKTHAKLRKLKLNRRWHRQLQSGICLSTNTQVLHIQQHSENYLYSRHVLTSYYIWVLY